MTASPSDMRAIVETSAAPTPSGPYAQGVITSGRLLFVAGQGPIDPATGEWRLGSFREQAEVTLANIAAIISAAGANVEDIVKLQVYLGDMRHRDEMNRCLRDWLGSTRPARTTVQSDLPGFDVEVDAIVALPLSER